MKTMNAWLHKKRKAVCHLSNTDTNIVDISKFKLLVASLEYDGWKRVTRNEYLAIRREIRSKENA